MWPTPDSLRPHLCSLTEPEVERSLENFENIKKGYLYHVQSPYGTETLVIPFAFRPTDYSIKCILFATSLKRNAAKWLRREWNNYKIKVKWLRGIWTEVDLSMLPCYIGIPYKSPFYEHVLSGNCTIKLPLLSARRKELNVTDEMLRSRAGLIAG
jgi:hypothetical protein